MLADILGVLYKHTYYKMHEIKYMSANVSVYLAVFFVSRFSSFNYKYYMTNISISVYSHKKKSL